MEARSTPALPTPLIPTKNNVLIFFDMTAFSWKSPEPMPFGAFFVAAELLLRQAVGPAWLSFFR
jgi:hypothetical protein